MSWPHVAWSRRWAFFERAEVEYRDRPNRGRAGRFDRQVVEGGGSVGTAFNGRIPTPLRTDRVLPPPAPTSVGLEGFVGQLGWPYLPVFR